MIVVVVVVSVVVFRKHHDGQFNLNMKDDQAPSARNTTNYSLCSNNFEKD